MGSQKDPGDGYRFLKDEEIIEIKDQYLCCCDNWTDIETDAEEIGGPFVEDLHVPFRRKIEAERSGADVASEDKPMAGLWRKDPATPEGKYLVQRRDGTVPEWPNFVLGAKDPAAPAALRAYARSARVQGMNEQFCSDVEQLARVFEVYRMHHGNGDPDRGRHRKDDPETIEKMKQGGSA